MKLQGLLKNVSYEVLQGTDNINISNIQYDSRKVTEGSLFVCIVGFNVDGHHYASSAVVNGAKALLVEENIEGINEHITIVKVSNTRKVIAALADRYYNHPSDKFRLIGVTGTNGKTSTTFLTKSILEAYGKKTGIIGTIENRIGDEILKAHRTTPESLDLQELFYNMVERNVNDVVMEVSSHSLDLHRVDACRFDVGVYTNLTLDHLDFHKTMENYRDAKLKLFNMCDTGVINLDDNYASYMIDNSSCKKYLTYGIDNDEADLNAVQLKMDLGGASFKVTYQGTTYAIKLATPGKFSVYNALAAMGGCLALAIPMETIKEGLEKNKGIRGRFQSFASKKGYNVIVDYAHAPDGLLNVLKSMKEFVKGRIITVFGCGGDRDRSKRPVMGEIAGRHSDYCVITSDNPRTEDPLSIVQEVEAGVKGTNCAYETVVDRLKGIHTALAMAKEGDLILIAGKGHEDYQVLRDEIIHFDDAEVVLGYFETERI
ncbi:UDP-N-acetylmuramoyl-L-alanyl-D-glutamate--2,6-diaminopimelate ligase [Vallitalea pronyensis]|uniref:UDP-N-acetylmuramoyl-L-alanyl-D-glutamate--2,6-diaminopimelate ligase n=1 Tax=Vallitalea pronyensis TaxID=1348613 RepID=A0A8J8SH95_9FIRM|nr:UDP-N-acetylmuramoyl-L-alanyl-D-glutamate--2,6-diaminopimelate ligase [Vallitalea pronyensis]QUI23204.1 UDP-N-acetylmuramoyl-L-alanyl-D-glutamate--2,6-diaminopimelate ligase [Vallitalea pronyensis]